MYILIIILILLILRVMINQQEIDEHICEANHEDDRIISNKGIINYIIWRIRVLYANTKWYLKHRKESE